MNTSIPDEILKAIKYAISQQELKADRKRQTIRLPLK